MSKYNNRQFNMQTGIRKWVFEQRINPLPPVVQSVSTDDKKPKAKN